MTELDTIRRLAERALHDDQLYGHCNRERDLARFALAVMEALDEAASGHVRPATPGAIILCLRAAIARKLEAPR